jgi:hypothetical protein
MGKHSGIGGGGRKVGRHRGLGALAALAITIGPAAAHGFVSAPVGGHPGELDVMFRLSLERGKIEPNENERSWQKARWNMYTLGAGYTYGDIGVLQDVSFRLEGTYYTSPAEENDPARGAVAADQCAGKVTGVGRCQFHLADKGGFVTPMVAFNLVHKGDFSMGLYLLGNIPIDVNFVKFVLPRTDWVGGGTQVGVHLTPWLGYESRAYVGTGAKGSRGRMNATIALTNLFVFEAKRWLLPWKAGVKAGTYFDGDLTERTDEVYDRAFTAGFDEGRRDRIRMMRFGLALFPYMQITERVALELGYVQKIFGYDTPATQFYNIGLRALF